MHAAGILEYADRVSDEERPTLSAHLQAYADTALRTDDGTILPPTVSPNTDDRMLIDGLPKLELQDSDLGLRLGATIGEGGMGIVRVADQVAVGRQVAVKTLRADRNAPEMVLHLLREAWMTGGLEHPNIIPVHNVGVDADGRPMIVMKRVEGEVWSTAIKNESRELRWHLKILEQVCQAVEFAGSRGIIHRDLKPDNVMIGRFGEVYVLDWGIAVSLHDDGSGRFPLAREVVGVAGTPGYMAPEMVSDTGEDLSVRTDVYLLGAILHEIITLKHKSVGGTLQAVLLASMASPPYEYAAHIPNELAQITNRATHVRPEHRFASAGAFREALEQFLEHESSRALSDSATRSMNTWAHLREGPEAPDPVAVQSLFGEARFGFEQALRAWPNNESAQAGFESCLETKFEYDLSRDDFESASVALATLGERRPKMAAQLEVSRAKIETRRAELTQLRRLQKARDLNVGLRTRAFFMMITAVAFGAIPPGAILARQLQWGTDYDYFFVGTVGKLIVSAGLTWWARDTLTKTQINRQLTAVLYLLMSMELFLRPIAQRLGHSVADSLLADFGLYGIVAATLAVTVDRRLWVCPLFYIVGAIVAMVDASYTYYALGAAHFFSYLYIARMWKPQTLFMTDEERVVLGRRPRRALRKAASEGTSDRS